MEEFRQDIRFAVRLLWKDKGFAITAIATLAVCIGANAAIFSVIDSVVFRPLPLPESGRIALMYNSYPNAGVERAATGVPDYYDRLRDTTVFEEQALYQNQDLTIGEKGSVQQVRGLAVTPSFFRLLRVKPRLGRTFSEEEGEVGNEQKVVLSYGLWQRLYGGDESVLGKDLRIYGNPCTIVGVMPESFLFLDSGIQLWRPLAFSTQQKSDNARHNNNWEMIGRLKPDATIKQAQAQIDAINAANLDAFPGFREILINAGFHTKVVRLQDEEVRDIKGTLYLLWGAVLFVLLIGAVNIANLVMTRSSARGRELATRVALGAQRLRIGRQLVTEGILLTCCGAVLGLLLGYAGLQALGTLGLDQIPRGAEIGMNSTVVLFILALSLSVGIVIGLIPVAQTLRLDMNMVFHQDLRTSTSGRGSGMVRNALVVVQVAFALVLLIGAGLLLSSFRHVLAIDPGFVPDRVITAKVSLPSLRYKEAAARRAFLETALERIRALPGVVGAGATTSLPFGHSFSDSVILAEGYQMKPGESLISPSSITVTPGYFEAMKIPLVAGRFFDERDTAESQRTIIVDERLARRFWPNENPIGKRMWKPNNPQNLTQPDEKTVYFTVVGVVGSIKLKAMVDPDERVGAYFYPYSQNSQYGSTLAVRTSVEPESLIPSLRQVISGLDGEIPLFDVHTMNQRIDESLIARRSPMLLSIGFGIIALLLSGVGIYGVLAYSVNQRTREIGIRMALGSSAETIFKLILKQAIWILAVGFMAGLGGALALQRYVESLLYQVRPLDPIVMAAGVAVLAVVALAACTLPGLRAARIDPIDALRQE
ncbi:MAG: ABC transporter permease [Acidobacteriota bacterium]